MGIPAARLVGPDGAVDAVDLSGPMVDELRRLSTDLPRWRPHQADVTTWTTAGYAARPSGPLATHRANLVGHNGLNRPVDRGCPWPDLFRVTDRSWPPRCTVGGVEGISHVSGQACIVFGDTPTGRVFAAEDGSTVMMPGPRTRIATPLATLVTEPPRHTLRLRLKPKAPTTGYVDGAWWPRSRELSAELPTLLAVLAVRLGHIVRVTYNLAVWYSAARRLTVAGHAVRLEGFHSQPAGIVTVIGRDHQRLTLLVVPPDTAPVDAHHTMMTASRRGNADSVEALLTAAPPGPAEASVHNGMDVATQRWEADGGRLSAHI